MTSALRVLVVDDELLARRRLVRLLGALPDVEIVGECDHAAEALARARTGVDVVLLDVEMPGLSGIEALELLPADGPTVILCTAHAEHAIAAFDGGAVDYLLKPVDAKRLSVAISRARARRTRVEPLATRLPIESAHGVVLLDPADISHLVLDGELVSLTARTGRYFSTEPLAELHARLPAAHFVRVHRRAVINVERVARFDPVASGGLCARMDDGSLVAISRQAARHLRRQWRL